MKLPQNRGYLYTEGGMVSPDGVCRTFDAQARGTVFGEGCGVVLLKRVDDALAEEVMVAYHRELAAGESASTALQRATADRLDAGVFCLYGGDWRVR